MDLPFRTRKGAARAALELGFIDKLTTIDTRHEKASNDIQAVEIQGTNNRAAG